MAEQISRTYRGFRGADFRSEECSLLRSPHCRNLWRDYRQTDGIRTRPGLEKKHSFERTVYGVFFFRDALLVHSGRKLWELRGEQRRLLYSGLLPQVSRTEIRDMAAWLEAEGYLKTEPEHQTVGLTEKASEVLYRGKTLQMPVRKEPKPLAVKLSTSTTLTGSEADLYDVLRLLRAKLAKESNVPPFVIFSNATLQDMARKMPKTVTEFKRVSGVGELKATWYAEPFLQAIRTFLSEN